MTDQPTADSTRTTSDDYEEKRAELIERTKERKQSLTEEQDAILDDIQQEHGGELIETTCRITPDHTVNVEVEMNGELMERLGEVERLSMQLEEQGRVMSGVGEIVREAASMLADMVADEEWNENLFMEIYRRNEPDLIADMLGNVGDAITAEQERKAGAVDGFRKK